MPDTRLETELGSNVKAVLKMLSVQPGKKKIMNGRVILLNDLMTDAS